MRVIRGLSWAQVAAQTKVSVSGFSRMADPAIPTWPSVPALTRILAWLGGKVRFEDFVEKEQADAGPGGD